jgi:hypothetical protein
MGVVHHFPAPDRAIRRATNERVAAELNRAHLADLIAERARLDALARMAEVPPVDLTPPPVHRDPVGIATIFATIFAAMVIAHAALLTIQHHAAQSVAAEWEGRAE